MEWLQRILACDRRTIARAITAIENDPARAESLRGALAAHLGRAHVVGITGPAGAGKSTLVNALVGELLKRGHTVAVVAIDPSSPFSGGAVLGDRIRMAENQANERVFIRSLASRGHAGGLSTATAQAVDVLDAAGFELILVETVGAGQSDVAIAKLARTRVVVYPPGLGDEVQALKAGVLEIADILVVNKADLPGADSTARDLLSVPARRGIESKRPVLKTVSTTGDGVAKLVDVDRRAPEPRSPKRQRPAAERYSLGFKQSLNRNRSMRDSSIILVLALWSSVIAAQPATDSTGAGMPPVVDAKNLYSETAPGKLSPGGCQCTDARVCAQPPIERCVRDRSGNDESGRQVSGRPQSAACRAVVGPEDAMGRQQRRRPYRRHLDSDRSGYRQARQIDCSRRSVQHVLQSRWALRDHRRRSAQASRFPRRTDDEDAWFVAGARVRRRQSRRLLD